MADGMNQFRGAALGGFNRQDVLKYLTETEIEYDKTLSQLRAELDGRKQAADEDKKRIEELETKLQEEARRNMDLQESLERVEAERDQKTALLKEKEEELFRYRANIADLEPKAIAYGKIKDRAASIELDAHARAQSTLDAAKQEAEQMQQEYTRCMQEAQGQYALLRKGLREAFTKSTVELELICQMFDQIAQDFDSYDDMLKELLNRAEELSAVAV